MQQAYKNLYKYRWQLTVIRTYKIGILLVIECGAHITRQHNTPLSRLISNFATLAIKLSDMKRTFVLISVRGKAISNISPGYERDGLLGELACIWRTPARQINPRRIKEAGPLEEALWERRALALDRGQKGEDRAEEKAINTRGGEQVSQTNVIYGLAVPRCADR